ncbi:LysR substrate-binding domain-containing protein [Orrella sp. JC864]|uniref:LysR substrate-binding domain-containing protein n=1 Tax=Orrella sp. JC864 TaxID=3120298 RepID=UPI003009C6E6
MATLPSLNAIKAFDAAAQAGSFSLAGEQLHVSHGAISHQVRQLESQLGCELFTRHPQGVQLTEAGRFLHDCTGRALADIARACQALRQRHLHPVLRLGCPGSFMMQWLIPRLDAFSRRRPRRWLQLQAGAGLAQLRQGGVDALLHFGAAPSAPDLAAWPLAENDLGPVCAPPAGKRAAGVQALLARPLLATASHPQAWQLWARTYGLERPAAAPAMRFEQFMYMIQAAIADLGVGIAPSLLVSQELREGRLAAPLGFVRTGQRAWLLARAGRDQDAALQALRDWLAQAMAQSQAQPARRPPPGPHSRPACQPCANSA